MALEIEIQTPTSAALRICYWRIDGYMVQPGLSVVVSLNGYWSKADRDANKMPVEQRRVQLLNAPEEITRAWLYSQIKAEPEFMEAADA